MFKNNKDNSFNFIGKEELESTYKHQEKLFNAKLEEQQHQINDLVNYISARFGEDVKNSDINAKIKNIETYFQSIEENYKSSLEKSAKLVEDKLNKSNEGNMKVFHEYNELFEKNNKEINDLKDIISKKDEKITQLNETIQKYFNENQEYKKYITDEFDNTNKKISKINYLGITNKFDKKLKEENEKLKNKIQELGVELDEYATITKQAMLEEQESINQCNKEIASINETMVSNNNILDSKIKDNNNELTRLNKKIEESSRENKQITNDTIKKLNEELKIQLSDSERQTNSKILELGKKFINNVDDINKNINNEIQQIDKRTSNSFNELNNKFNEQANQNSVLLNSLQNDFTLKLEQGNIQVGKKIKKLEDIINTNGKGTDEQIHKIKNAIRENYKNITLWGKNLEDIKEKQKNLFTSYEEKLGTLSDQGEEFKTKFDAINIFMDKYETEAKNIQEEYRNRMEEISNSILNLKSEAKENLKNTKSNNELIDFKKEYNDLIKKINKDLGLIQNEVAQAQKKNMENNKNLQLKIKSYVDKKIEIVNSQKVNNLDELLDKINLSIIEKEKLQRKETEELLNKKLKEIQKENERIINKKIEEMNQAFKNETVVNNPNEVDYKINVIKPKKKIYDILDDSTILKQTASSNKVLNTKEGKSQILKFFYDDDDLN